MKIKNTCIKMINKNYTIRCRFAFCAHWEFINHFELCISFRLYIPKSFSMVMRTPLPFLHLRVLYTHTHTRTYTNIRTHTYMYIETAIVIRTLIHHCDMLSVFKLLKWAGFAVSFMLHFRCYAHKYKNKMCPSTEWIERCQWFNACTKYTQNTHTHTIAIEWVENKRKTKENGEPEHFYPDTINKNIDNNTYNTR